MTNPSNRSVPTSKLLRQQRRQRLESYRHSPQDIEAHFREEGQIQSDYHRRFVYELIQNADDALETTEDDDRRRLRFELCDDVLLVANNGRPIDADDVEALCTMSYTTKSATEDRRASIGHKGKGFSSVLDISNNPQVFSRLHSFEFHPRRSRRAIEQLLAELDDPPELSGVPIMRLPFEPAETHEPVRRLFGEGFRTVFRFPLNSRQSADIHAGVAAGLRALDANTLVFLRHLNELEIRLDDRRIRWSLQRHDDGSAGDRGAKLITVTTDDNAADEASKSSRTFALFARRDIPIGDHKDGLSENTWGNVNLTEVSVAVPVEQSDDEWVFRPFEDHPYVHVFLPTQERSPLPILINGAFHSTISRTRIEVGDDPRNYNGFLLSHVADLLANDVRRFAAKTGHFREFIRCLRWKRRLDEADDEVSVQTLLVDRIRRALRDVPFIPVAGSSAPATVDEVLLPYHSEGQAIVADTIAELVGHRTVELPDQPPRRLIGRQLITPAHIDTLDRLGAAAMSALDVPRVLAGLPDDHTTAQPPQSDEHLAVDPVLDVLLATWKTVNADDELADQFRDPCRRHALFPTGPIADDGTVRRVAGSDDVLFFPPDIELPDIELSGMRFLSRRLYRPLENVGSNRQAELIAGLKPALETIWDVREFQFEEVLRAAVRPKLSGDDTGRIHELHNARVLWFLATLAERSIGSTPLPYTERRKRRAQFSLTQLPLPTRDGNWKPAHTLYFGDSWHDDDTADARRIEPLADCAGLELSYLADPDHFDNDDDTLELLHRFFRWIGVSPMLRLQPLFPPDRNQQLTKTKGLKVPTGTHIARLSDDQQRQYITHLREELAHNNPRKHDYLYRIHDLEHADELFVAAGEDIDVGRRLLAHLSAWWEDHYSDFRRATVATTGVSTLKRRQNSSWSFRSRELRRLGLNLWLWRLRHTRWCPTSLGNEAPRSAWVRSDQIRKLFSLPSTRGPQLLLPVVDDRLPGGLERALGLQRQVNDKTFSASDAATVCDSIQIACAELTDDELAANLSAIRPRYRTISEVLPAAGDTDTEQMTVPVLCRDDGAYRFADSDAAVFVRSPDERQRLPVYGMPIFVLESDEAINFAAYFGVHDLRRCVCRSSHVDGELPEHTDRIRRRLSQLGPYLLCRLEATRRAAHTQTEDVTNLRNFIDRLTVVDGLTLQYSLTDYAAELPMTIGEAPRRSYFLDPNRSRQQGRIPLIDHRCTDEGRLDETLARALCEFMDVQHFESILTLLSADTPAEWQRLLRLSGAPWQDDELESKRRALDTDHSALSGMADISVPARINPISTPSTGESDTDESRDNTDAGDRTRRVDPKRYELLVPEELRFSGEQIPTSRTVSAPDSRRTAARSASANSNHRSGSSLNRVGPPKEYPHEVDHTGTKIAMRYERRRLRNEFACDDAAQFVAKVHNPELVEVALEDDVVGDAVNYLLDQGLNRAFPGFDILTVRPDSGEVDRLIELKSSGLAIRKVGITWNEWKTASHQSLRDRYYLYVVGGLRRETNTDPFLREIRNPFEVLRRREKTEQTRKQRQIQLDLRYFDADDGEVRQTELRATDSDSR